MRTRSSYSTALVMSVAADASAQPAENPARQSCRIALAASLAGTAATTPPPPLPIPIANTQRHRARRRLGGLLETGGAAGGGDNAPHPALRRIRLAPGRGGHHRGRQARRRGRGGGRRCLPCHRSGEAQGGRRHGRRDQQLLGVPPATAATDGVATAGCRWRRNIRAGRGRKVSLEAAQVPVATAPTAVSERTNPSKFIYFRCFSRYSKNILCILKC